MARATPTAAASSSSSPRTGPELVERAVLLDPAIRILPTSATTSPSSSAPTPRASPEDAIEARLAGNLPPPREALEEEDREHLVRGRGRAVPLPLLPLGRGRDVQRHLHRAAGALDAPRPGAARLRAQFGLVRGDQLEAYADRAEIVAVPAGHKVYWDAFDETADAVERFLG